MNIINFQKNKMLPLKKNKLKLYQDGPACYICGKKIDKK